MLEPEPTYKYNLTISVVLFRTDVNEVQNIIEKVLTTNLVAFLYLVDNSPTDELRNSLILNEKVKYIYTGKNLGFGSGHNIAIKLVKNISEFHLVLNADIDFNIEILDTIYFYMKEHPEIGLLGPKVLNLDGTVQFTRKLLPTPIDLIVRRFIPFNSIKNYIDNRYELKSFANDRIVEIPFLMGCFLFINTKVFSKLDGFDERFFMYMEDIDISRRIHSCYKTIYYPKVSITHSHERESYKNYTLLLHHIKSSIRYFNKWGWIFDRDRKKINRNIQSQFQITDIGNKK